MLLANESQSLLLSAPNGQRREIRYVCSYISWVCPNCLTPVSEMTLVGTDEYSPTFDEKASRPLFDKIGRDVFICSCGARLTWYDMFGLRLIEFAPVDDAPLVEDVCLANTVT